MSPASGQKQADPAVTVSGPGSPKSEPALLTLFAKHNAGSKPGAYTKFNQTITIKRTKAEYNSKEETFEVGPGCFTGAVC